MSKEVEEHEDSNEAKVQKQKTGTVGITPPKGIDLLKQHPLNDNEGTAVPCRAQDFVEFVCADQAKKVRLVTNLKKKVGKGGGGPNPHSQSKKAIRESVFQGNKKSAIAERLLLKESLKDAEDGNKKNILKAIRDIDLFIEYFRDDVIRGNRQREPRSLRNDQSTFTLGRLKLGFNNRTVALFKSKHEGDSIYGGVFLQVTDQSPFDAEQRMMMAYLMQLLLKSNYAEKEDKVKPQFCYAVDIPAKLIAEAPADAKRLHDRLLKASEEFAAIWDSTPPPAES